MKKLSECIRLGFAETELGLVKCCTEMSYSNSLLRFVLLQQVSGKQIKFYMVKNSQNLPVK